MRRLATGCLIFFTLGPYLLFTLLSPNDFFFYELLFSFLIKLWMHINFYSKYGL